VRGQEIVGGMQAAYTFRPMTSCRRRENMNKPRGVTWKQGRLRIVEITSREVDPRAVATTA
jgi:hypothetical protein